MKIYNKIIISIESGEVLCEDSFEYHGEILECKGGGSTTTNTVDYSYNSRMAAIAEQQQAMANEYFDYWKSDYQPYEKAQIKANMELMPGETSLAKEKISSQRELLPFQTNVAKDYYAMVLKGVNAEEETGKARTDVMQSFKLTEGERRREFGRMGVDPSSPAFASQRSADLREQVKAMAGAGTTARRYAEEETMRRLREAM